MKKNVTYIESAKFAAIVSELGLPSKPQAGFVKVDLGNGRQVYVAITKRVGRVDLSCFSLEGPGFVQLGGESFGNVRCQVDFSLPEAAILAAFRRCLEEGRKLEQWVAPKRVQPGTPKAAKPAEDLAMAAKAKLARLDLIKKVAREKGMPVSESVASADRE